MPKEIRIWHWDKISLILILIDVEKLTKLMLIGKKEEVALLPLFYRYRNYCPLMIIQRHSNTPRPFTVVMKTVMHFI